MSIRNVVAIGFMAIFSSAVAMTGCGVNSAEDAEAPVDTEPVAVSVDCQANSPSNYAGPNYAYAIAATQTTLINAVDNKNTVYDVTSYCNDAMNARRRTPHSVTKNGVTTNINPYYNLYDTDVVPSYSPVSINVSSTSGTSVCRLCKGLADADKGGHAGNGACYGISPEATGPLTNDNSVGFCGAGIGQTAKQVVDNCLNAFENESGSAGHKGPIVWDSTRGISCVIGVFVDPTTLAKKAGITLSYSWPLRNGSMRNGGNCKVSGECLSKRCQSGRCVGFASSSPWNGTSPVDGVSSCPASPSKNCSEHPEDPLLCFSNNLACASGSCSSGKCLKGGTSKSCVTNDDCLSGVCSSTKTCT